jgi:hypothetical protein
LLGANQPGRETDNVPPINVDFRLTICLYDKKKRYSPTGRGVLSCYEAVRIPHCPDNRLINGGEIVKPYAMAALYSSETFPSLSLVIISVRG